MIGEPQRNIVHRVVWHGEGPLTLNEVYEVSIKIDMLDLRRDSKPQLRCHPENMHALALDLREQQYYDVARASPELRPFGLEVYGIEVHASHGQKEDEWEVSIQLADHTEPFNGHPQAQERTEAYDALMQALKVGDLAQVEWARQRWARLGFPGSGPVFVRHPGMAL